MNATVRNLAFGFLAFAVFQVAWETLQGDRRAENVAAEVRSRL